MAEWSGSAPHHGAHTALPKVYGEACSTLVRSCLAARTHQESLADLLDCSLLQFSQSPMPEIAWNRRLARPWNLQWEHPVPVRRVPRTKDKDLVAQVPLH